MVKYDNRLKKIKYDDKVNYKRCFLSIFNQKYHSQSIEFYKDLWNIQEIEMLNCGNKIGAYILLILPFTLFAIPFLFGLEIYTYSVHRKYKYQYCECDSCYKNINVRLSKYFLSLCDYPKN
jgi:hypothetical protein